MNLYPFQHSDESRIVIIAENPCPEPGTHSTNHRIQPEFALVTTICVADLREQECKTHPEKIGQILHFVPGTGTVDVANNLFAGNWWMLKEMHL